ncbi:anti-sigma factor domain-containing protein [Gloeobacter kilaueensis]|uniref:Regulator of SigK n=1 Tax=Gloeobacter kilaueensis (strain ATCC BAA-2537 / CCAP 1431/1 / ULC 316 / JS1) TaxID=1183438 RepID=U5QIJ6_GLOK1|nr:anti-sigma factor [Gloeobacter kilaueensis]AGY58756.1 anti-sigmaE protein [Gloeobacter kilaueensis JS1]
MNQLPDERQAQMAGYLLDDLGEAERRDFEQWLGEHPEAQAELARLQQTLNLLPYGLEGSAPPASLRDRIVRSATVQQKRPRLLSWAPLAIAAALIAILGFDSWQLRGQLAASNQQVERYRDLVSMLRENDTRLVALKGMSTARDATGNILITPGTPEVVVTLRNLPPPARGEVYKLWAVVEGRKVACGEFMPGPEGSVYAKLPLTAQLLSAPLVVTREVAGSAIQTGPMVMTSSI